MRRLLLLVAIAAATIVVGAGPAAAHAEVRTSDPASGGVAPEGTAEISLTFITMDAAEPVEVSVLDPDGNEVTTGDPRVTDTGATGTTVEVPVEPLAIGTHFVSWKAHSTDGDGISAGSYEFAVEASSGGGGFGVWLLWIVALAIPAAFFLLPRSRGRKTTS